MNIYNGDHNDDGANGGLECHNNRVSLLGSA